MLSANPNAKCIQLDSSLLVYRNGNDYHDDNGAKLRITFERVKALNTSHDAILIANLDYGGDIHRKIWLIASYVVPTPSISRNARLEEIRRVLDSIAVGNEIIVFGDLNTTIDHHMDGSLYLNGSLSKQLFENLKTTFKKHNYMKERNWHTNHFGNMTDCAYATPQLHVSTQVIPSVYN